MSNPYWTGEKHAKLTKELIDADWKEGRYGDNRIKAVNRAFCIWYWGRKAANDAGSQAMHQSLEECGTSGWGFGVSDLEDAFNHLERKSGYWTDNDTTTLNCLGAYVTEVPVAIESFLSAVDSIDEQIGSAMSDTQEKCITLSGLNLTSTDPAKMEIADADLYNAKKAMKDISKIGKAVETNMWRSQGKVVVKVPLVEGGMNMNVMVDGPESDFARMRQVGSTVFKTLSFAATVLEIKRSAELYTKADQVFDDKKVAAALAGMSLALSFVPVLGSFYGEIVNRIPELAHNWEIFIKNYTDKIDRASKGIVIENRDQNKQKDWKCEECNATTLSLGDLVSI